jgi:hypothetical protein
MMGRVTVTLPAAAQARLQALTIDRDMALDASRACASRLSQLPGDADQQMRDRLAGEQAKQGRKHAVLHQLVSRVQQWQRELPSGVELELVAPPVIELKPGEKVADAIEAVRGEIRTVRERIAIIRSAPLPKAAQQHLAAEYTVRMAQAARPQVRVVNDQLRVSYRGDMAATEDVVSLLAWIMPEALCEALERELAAAQPARTDAMSSGERMQRTAELDVQLLALERREEALITAAQEQGLVIERRPDASPLAVLNVEIATAAKQVA